MSQECNGNGAELAPKVGQKINPGLEKAVWDELLVRSGIDPATITEYNVQNSAAEDETLSQK